MKGMNFTVSGVIGELTEFNRKVASSYSTLLNIDEIDVGQTPTETLYREDKLKLVRYQSDTPKRCRTPLLICYALVNRPYVVDLEPDRSLVRRLLGLGLDIYLIDWGYPDAADRCLDLDDYINGYLDNCVEQVRAHSGQDRINLLGICQGGTFSLCYSALHPEKVRNLITLVTPVDFQTPDNLLSHLARQVDADLAVDTYGNIPGEMLNDSYNSLMPMRLGIQKNLAMPNLLKDRESALSFLRMEKWIYDSPDQAGEAFRQFVKDCFQQNKLMKSEMTIGGQAVELHRINHPILNVYGEQDHLVPPSASKALAGLTSSSDYEELSVPAGHIGVFVSGRSQALVPPKIADWLIARDA
ncbi:poly-beta-hydroxybutyrate polymerase [Marinobacterium nitratireducens]|uniref:Poly(3-hydroxyalkanoate) polymerase subunit PhaC n=1 Tax=Marinobacterium nitratireducens TaxID=518897 RepID=A0A918DMZ6_9GAMM|nr:class III poly(R)-hydroxyalkanoic acid synthase subunit PhaC [Marinobacterium nitratireducens]GGO75921.1 poly-beta-hydroxybutyrate polymerase [Marinobacterium nitratireducens]